jgi:hypothetical protein
LDSIMFGTNKGYRSCSPCHHSHIIIEGSISWSLFWRFYPLNNRW